MSSDNPMIPGRSVFEARLYDDEFLADVARIRALQPGSLEELEQGTHIAELIDKYGIPSWFSEVLAHYIESDSEVDWSLAINPVKVSTTEHGGVVLRLAHDIKKTQFKRYINDFFDEEIKPLLNRVASERRQRHSAPYYPREHQKAQRLHKNKQKLGLDTNAIALRANVSARTVSRAVQQNKKKK
jgi:hypothetical protein